MTKAECGELARLRLELAETRRRLIDLTVHAEVVMSGTLAYQRAEKFLGEAAHVSDEEVERIVYGDE